MFGLGAQELLVIGVFALIFIGPKKLPELAKGLGKAMREFQKAKDNLMAEVDQVNIAKDVQAEMDKMKADGAKQRDEHLASWEGDEHLHPERPAPEKAEETKEDA